MATEQSNQSTVKSAKNTFRILETLQKLDGASVTEVSDYLGMSKSNVYKYLNTLEKERYIVKSESKDYHLGLRFLGMGAESRRRYGIYETAKPEIMELAEESNEMANLMVEEHGRGIFLYRADSNRAINLDTHAGRDVYLHTTAMGKAILAHLPEDRVNEIIRLYGLPRETPNTITDRGDLFNDLEEIRERGWAYDNEERLKGLQCVAGAILDPDGVVLGAISISGPSSRITGTKLDEEFPEAINNAKSVIELNIAYG